MKIKPLLLVLLAPLFWVWTSCDKNEHILPPDQGSDSILVRGSGSFVFSGFAPLKAKPVRVWYHIPESSGVESPLLIVFTGANRDAKESRDALIQLANKKNLLVFVPEFNDSLFPGGNQYNLGNLFVNGEKPGSSALNPEDQWTFSLIEPLFDFIRQWTGYSGKEYDAFGHSAGAQFLHRFLFFKPQNRIRKAVASSAGWYTLPDTTVQFPYGLQLAPHSEKDILNYFSFPLTVCVGDQDNDPNAASLRHTTAADTQGSNRYDRAFYFFNESKALAASRPALFQWQIRVIPNADHDFNLTSAYAVNLLYP